MRRINDFLPLRKIAECAIGVIAISLTCTTVVYAETPGKSLSIHELMNVPEIEGGEIFYIHAKVQAG